MKNLSLIRPNQLADLLSISIPTLYRMISNGELPPKVRIGKRAVGWRRSQIEEWMDERTEEPKQQVLN
ncbi:helix-turn-helix transcriptional regulator [Fodinibius sp. SL11]|jgi:prophage regulatory protein|uniref:helix-turn-helix transcriptional regulator n=1 Tax=Fodinibius sp. SL11 TaxID=3425690 RepID=UPI003F882490